MASPQPSPRSGLTLLLALCALASEGLAWWWVGAQGGAGWMLPRIMLGLLGMLLAGAAAVLLLRANRLHARALRQARKAERLARENLDAAQKAHHAAAQERDLLITAFDALPLGVAVFDQHDREVLRNTYLDQLLPDAAAASGGQESLQAMLRRELQLGLVPDAQGDEQQWIAERLAARGSGGQSILQKHPGDRWVLACEVQTRQGLTVAARTDVTELVRREELLAQTNEQLSLQSATDGLTGIANRRRFDETLASEWLRAARAGSCLSLLMVDIDHFKRYNDHYGHVAGDECLRRVTAVLAACVRRAGELLARYGGEEFVMLLPGADLAQAEDMAQRCLARMQREQIPHGASPTRPVVTFSIGVAHVFPNAAQAPGSLVNAADTAMYRAKTAGRACYAVADLADWEIDKDAPRSRPGELN